MDKTCREGDREKDLSGVKIVKLYKEKNIHEQQQQQK
jgi:hypothetical protein